MKTRVDSYVNQLSQTGITAQETYLDAVLKLCKCTSVPKSKQIKVKKIIIYLEAPTKNRSYILKSSKELQYIYLSRTSRAASGSWSINKLIDLLVTNKISTGGRAGKNQNDDMLQKNSK